MTTVYLDLDRTLFRTNDAGKIWHQIAEHYPNISPEAEKPRAAQFYVRPVEDLYYYDFSAHLRDLGFEPSEVYAYLEASPLANNQLLFDGAVELIDWIKTRATPAILTFGIDDYQRLKIALCPALAGLDVNVTLQPKGEWLKDKGACWLVDDKAIGEELPPNVRFIQVSLEGQLIPPSSWPNLRSLEAVREHLYATLR